MILAGDIGGTKTLIGLFERATPRPRPVLVRVYPTLAHAGLPAIIDLFLAEGGGRPAFEAAVFGVAGPVIDQTAEMTNVPWIVDAAEIRDRFACARVRLLNDLQSMAHAVPYLHAGELKPLQAGTRQEDGNIALIAAGTGLGTSILHWVHGGYEPVASEGGHADFAGRTERELEFVRFLTARYGRAEVEHVLSGPGLLNLADFTHADGRCERLGGISEPAELPAEVSRAALEGACERCIEALDLFVSIYGAEAGNLALTAVTTGGVFIGGGIAPRILPALENGRFLDAFNAKGPMRPLLEAMPVQVILNAEAGLLGAAVYAAAMT